MVRKENILDYIFSYNNINASAYFTPALLPRKRAKARIEDSALG